MDIICNKFDYQINLDSQRKLFVDCFPENIGTIVVDKKHYMWKFHSIQAEPKSYEYTAWINNDMAGYYAAIPYAYKIANQTFTAAMVCDVMTSSQFRGKGVFTKLGRYSLQEMNKEGVPFALGYPIRKEVIPGHLKVGWKIAFRQPLYMKFLTTKSLFKERRKPYLYYIVDPFVKLYNCITNPSVYRHEKYIVKICKDIEEVKGYNNLVEEWSSTVSNALDKSLDFAKWRYGAPEKEYTFIGVYDNKQLVGFSSIREIVKEGVPSIGILDFMVLPNHKDAINYIHHKIIQLAKERNREIIMTMMSKSSASVYKLLKNGYLKSPFIFHVIINKLNSSLDDSILFDEKNWHLMFVDSDDL